MLRINLQEMGEDQTFSAEELGKLERAFLPVLKEFQSILEVHVKSVQAAEQSNEEMQTDGTPCEVDITTVDRQLFENKRDDQKQEKLRLLIVEALTEADKNPAYRCFSNMIPKKTWESKRAGQLEEIANKWGGHTTDWVEWALEFAQRITNGESWEKLCNEKDTLDWYRVIRWKDGNMKMVGGSLENNDSDAPADVGAEKWHKERLVAGAVPLITIPK